MPKVTLTYEFETCNCCPHLLLNSDNRLSVLLYSCVKGIFKDCRLTEIPKEIPSNCPLLIGKEHIKDLYKTQEGMPDIYKDTSDALVMKGKDAIEFLKREYVIINNESLEYAAKQGSGHFNNSNDCTIEIKTIAEMLRIDMNRQPCYFVESELTHIQKLIDYIEPII